MDTTRTLLADKLPDILNRTFFAYWPRGIRNFSFFVTKLSDEARKCKKGNRRREFMPRARTLRTHWVLLLFANQSYKTWAEANHSDECIPRTEICREVLCWGTQSRYKKAQIHASIRCAVNVLAITNNVWTWQRRLYGPCWPLYEEALQTGISWSKTRLAGGWETASYQNHDGWLRAFNGISKKS